MSSHWFICKICLIIYCLKGTGTVNYLFAQTGKSRVLNEDTLFDYSQNEVPSDTIQIGDHYLDNQFIITGRLGKIFFVLPSDDKVTISPIFYYKSNYFSKEIWGGIMGTGIMAGLNYIFFPYLAFSPEWRSNHVFMNVAFGAQLAIGGSIAGVGIGLLPFGGLGIGYNSYPLSKKFALNAEAGVHTIIIPGNHYPMYPYLNVGLVYRRHR